MYLSRNRFANGDKTEAKQLQMMMRHFLVKTAPFGDMSDLY